MSRISAHLKAMAVEPPWFVRLLGALLLGGDAYWWLSESSPTALLELAKHGLLLAIGLACFYPEGLVLVTNSARRLPFFDRRGTARKDPPHAD